jgi:hypothetical protein
MPADVIKRQTRQSKEVECFCVNGVYSVHLLCEIGRFSSNPSNKFIISNSDMSSNTVAISGGAVHNKIRGLNKITKA